GGHVRARANGPHDDRRAASARRQASLYRDPDQPDHRGGDRLIRDAGRRADRRARRGDRLRRRAGDRADDPRAPARGLPARRIPARPWHDRHGGAAAAAARDPCASLSALDSRPGGRSGLSQERPWLRSSSHPSRADMAGAVLAAFAAPASASVLNVTGPSATGTDPVLLNDATEFQVVLNNNTGTNIEPLKLYFARRPRLAGSRAVDLGDDAGWLRGTWLRGYPSGQRGQAQPREGVTKAPWRRKCEQPGALDFRGPFVLGALFGGARHTAS